MTRLRGAAGVMLVVLAAACGRHPEPRAVAGKVAKPEAIEPSACPVADGRNGRSPLSFWHGDEGRLGGCFVVGDLASGRYAVTMSATSVVPSGQLPRPDVEVALLPDHGPPGTTVTITGFVPGAARAGEGPSQGGDEVCWDGCRSGLRTSTTVDWSSDGHFTTTASVPKVAWLENDGPHRLRAGRYPIAVRCLRAPNQSSSGCEYGAGQGEALFTVTRPASDPCTRGGPCVDLRLARRTAQPGDVVRVSGFAPVDGEQSWLSFELGEDPPPPTTGTEGSGKASPSTVTRATLARAALEVVPGAQWAALPPSRPTDVQPGTGDSFRADPADDLHLAVCERGRVRLSGDGGTTWRSVDTRAVREAAKRHGWNVVYTDSPPDTAACHSALEDHTGTVYTVFGAWPDPGGPPPSWWAGFFTRDGGRHWETVPAPPRSSAERFGGFAKHAGAVTAWFQPTGSDPEQANGPPPADQKPLVNETTDGGATWRQSPERCPSAGPCVTWGPDTAVSCAKGIGGRLIRRSGDGGTTWGTPVRPAVVSNCETITLVARSDGGLWLLASSEFSEPFALQRSTDGGQTWTPVHLPRLGDPRSAGFGYPHLTPIADGGLLAFAGGPHVLRPGSAQWCPAPADVLPDELVHLEAVGQQLWYTTSDGRTTHIEQQQIKCRR